MILTPAVSADVDPSPTTATPTPTPRKPSTLLSVLPWTTAWGGAAAVCLVPIGFALVALVFSGSAEGLQVLAVAYPVMLGGALALWFYGLVAGLLAGLPDWLLRRRPELRLLGAVLAVVVITVMVTVPWAIVVTKVTDLSWLSPTGVSSSATVAAAAALATTVVVALQRRRARRRG